MPRLLAFLLSLFLLSSAYAAENEIWHAYYNGINTYAPLPEGVCPVFGSDRGAFVRAQIENVIAHCYFYSCADGCPDVVIAGTVFRVRCAEGEKAVVSPDGSSVQCKQCDAGKVFNPFNHQCQNPCPAADTSHSEFDSAPGEFYSGQYCVGGCAVKSEVIVDICGAINFPGAECAMQGHSFVYTGLMCGGNNPPPTGPKNPPGCEAGELRVGNVCYPACGNGGIRNSTDLSCSCPAGFHDANGSCEKDPACDSWEHYDAAKKSCVNNDCPYGSLIKCGTVNGQEKCQCTSSSDCPPGALKDRFGNCIAVQCPAGTTFNGKDCSDGDGNNKCPEGMVRDAQGNCVSTTDNKPPECEQGTHVVPGCGCVKDGSPIVNCKVINSSGPSHDVDGDGNPNKNDPDVDGDGTNNADDPDDDGDGVPDIIDSTPRGSNSSGRGTGDGDDDGDGIPNKSDPDADLDGDGIPNSADSDKNGDGIPDLDQGEGSGNGDPNKGPGDCDPTKEDCSKKERQAGGSCDAFNCSGDSIDCAIAQSVWEENCRSSKRKFDGSSRSCDSFPKCEGDELDCAVVRQTWEQNCRQQPGDDGILGEIKSSVGSTYKTGLEPPQGTNGSVDVKDVLDTSGFLGHGSCPAPYALSLLGKSYSVSYQPFCDIAIQLSSFVVGLAMLIAARIVSRAF